jgi:hypothetical protein
MFVLLIKKKQLTTLAWPSRPLEALSKCLFQKQDAKMVAAAALGERNIEK